MLLCIVALTAALAVQLYLPLPPAIDAHLLPAVLVCCLMMTVAHLIAELRLMLEDYNANR